METIKKNRKYCNSSIVLGNSKRQNKGKKYIKKDDIDLVYAEEAEHFNNWFANKYNVIVEFIKNNDILDKDILHKTYCNVYDKILSSGIDGNDYMPYFRRAYFTNFINTQKKESRYCELLLNTDKEDNDITYFSEIEEKQKRLEQDIINYIYINYSLRDFELFKMYMNLKPAINYISLSKITGVMPYTIQRTISKIKKDISNNTEFLKRRNNL